MSCSKLGENFLMMASAMSAFTPVFATGSAVWTLTPIGYVLTMSARRFEIPRQYSSARSTILAVFWTFFAVFTLNAKTPEWPELGRTPFRSSMFRFRHSCSIL